MHVNERVEVHIAMECNMWPVDRQGCSFCEDITGVLDTPIPSVGEDELLFVKRPRLEPAHVSVSDGTVSGFRLR
jgi:hypothetical protein